MDQQPGQSILFIGNSYTFEHDLPGQVEHLSAAGGRPIYQESVAVGGATLEDLYADGTGETVGRIAARPWTVVVLQEQSMRPIVKRSAFFRGVRRFATRIQAAGARPLLYLTWPRESSPGDIERLAEAYYAVASEIGAQVAPVGPAWIAARHTLPNLTLYDADGSHPSPAGTYLAACVFYAAIHSADPAGLPAIGVSAATAAALQRIAWQTHDSR